MTPGERVEFTGRTGQTLIGSLRCPDAAVQGSALIAHCFTCSKDLHTTTRLARGLTDAGYLTMTFDFTGLGESGGEFHDTSVSTNVGDVRRAAVALIERGAGPCVVIGHSLGGAAVILAAAALHTVDAVVAVASPSSVGHVRRLIGAADEAAIRAEGSAVVDVGGRPFRLSRQFLEDLESHDVVEAAAGLGRPLLVVRAGRDTVVGEAETQALAAAGPASLITVAEADHLFSDPAHARQLSDDVVAWLGTIRDRPS